VNITIVASSLSRNSGGIGPVMWALASHCMRAGMRVELLSLWDEYVEKDCPSDGLPYRTFQVTGPRSLGYSSSLSRAIECSGADVLHLHGLWMYPGVAARKAANKLRVPLIISPHGMLDPWALRNSSWKKRVAGWLYENANLRSATCIHALCNSEFESVRLYGLKNPVAVIPNGIDLPAPVQGAPPWDGVIEPGKKVVLFLGRLHPKKGLPQLIEAWRLTGKPARAPWALAIVGWDQEGHHQELQSLIAQHGLEREVYLLGPRFGDEKTLAYQHADAFVLPSFSEGLPMAVLEAWAWELPVLMTPECNLPCGFEKNAALRISTDSKALASQLESFFRLTDGEREQLGRNGRTLAEASFAWPGIAKQMVSVYEWVLGGGPPPECVRMD